MRNITVSVDDDTYRRSRILAAELDTSVSALVRAFLQSLAVDAGREAATRARGPGSSVELRSRELERALAAVMGKVVREVGPLRPGSRVQRSSGIL